MAKPIHVMIRVRDEARSVDFYHRTFGLEVAARRSFPNFTLVYLRGQESPFELELTINHDRAEPYALGDGYGHMGIVVDDLDAEHARFQREGLEPNPLREMQHEGAPMARFFFVSDPDGYRIEVLQRMGHFT
jgi:lactoylglutathione lyase